MKYLIKTVTSFYYLKEHYQEEGIKNWIMKYIFTFMLIFLFLSTNGQVLSFVDNKFVGEKLNKVIEKSIKYKDSWREFYFDKNSRLIEKKYFRDYKEVQNIKYEYTVYDSVLIVKETTSDIYNRLNINILKSFFDINRKLIRFEKYFQEDTLVPAVLEKNIVFNDQGKVVSYDRYLYNTNSVYVQLRKIDYSKNGKVLTIREVGSPETETLKYDHKGNMTDWIFDYHDPQAVIAGAKTWSRNRRDKNQLRYKYDNYGNWIKEYAVTKFWRYKLNEREITYNLQEPIQIAGKESYK